MKEIPICTHYDISGKQVEAFPFPALLEQAKPVYTTMPGWNCDISGIREYEQLPQQAKDYIEYIESALGCPITYVSVGPDRDAIILR